MQPYSLLPCPLCGWQHLEEYENNGGQATAIYCTKCPYGVEDCTKTLEELRAYHNKRRPCMLTKEEIQNLKEDLKNSYREFKKYDNKMQT